MDATKVDRNWFESALGESGFKPVSNWFGILLVWTGLKAFMDLKNVLAKQLEHCATSAANYAYGADLITDEAYKKVFARDMETKSNAARVSYLIDCVRDKIGTAGEDAKAKMSQFLAWYLRPRYRSHANSRFSISLSRSDTYTYTYKKQENSGI